MPLTSKSSSLDIARSFSATNLRTGDTTTYDPVMNRGIDSVFVVSPSPCFNGTGRKAVGEYSFTKTNTIWPHGQKTWQVWSGYLYRTEYVESGNMRFAAGPWNTRPGFASQLDKARFRAISKLVNELRDSSISLSTTIGEGRETLVMLKVIADKAEAAEKQLRAAMKEQLGPEKYHRWLSRRQDRKLLSALRSNKNGVNVLRNVGSLWLGWSVGLAPLLSDLANLRGHMLNEESSVIETRSVKSRASEFQSYNDGVWNGNFSERCELSLQYRISDLHLFENWRAGLTMRPSSAWELVTLSFVVDYFFNFGQYLQNLEASILNNGVSTFGGYETITRKEEMTCDYRKSEARPSADFDSYIVPDVGYVVQCNVRSYYEQTYKSRTRISSIPTSPLPPIKIPKAANALLNLAALLSQVLSRRDS